jgi:hypothetical protein
MIKVMFSNLIGTKLEKSPKQSSQGLHKQLNLSTMDNYIFNVPALTLAFISSPKAIEPSFTPLSVISLTNLS